MVEGNVMPIFSPSLESIQSRIYSTAAPSNMGLAAVLGSPPAAEQVYSGMYPLPANIENQNATQLEWKWLYQWFVRSQLIDYPQGPQMDVASWNFGLLAQGFLTAKNTLTGVLGNNLYAQEIRPETWYAGAFSTATLIRTWANQTFLINQPGTGTIYGGWSQGANTSAVPTHNGFFVNLSQTNSTTLLNTYNQVTMIWWGIADLTQVTASNAATATIPAAASAYQAPLLVGLQARDSSGNFQGVIGLPYQRVLANTTFRYFPTAYNISQSQYFYGDLEFDPGSAGTFTGGASTVTATLVPLGAQFVKPQYYTPEQ